MREMLTIGLMSGTSLDGIDGVLARISADGQPKLLARASHSIPNPLRTELLALNQPGSNELHHAALAANMLAHAYAAVVDELLQLSATSPGEVAAIGAHGQTVRHRPELCYTIQLNAPALLAELTGIGVVADFRSRDVAAGGQGAPLVPAFHQAVFGQHRPCIILNLGGIANVSILRESEPVIGFDTGPANVLLDLWCERHTHQPFDHDGRWGASGKISQALLANLLTNEPWFKLPPPKSTGRDLFNMAWLDQRMQDHESVATNDVQATLVALTAQTVTDALRSIDAGGLPVFVCGGGAKNPHLLYALQSRWDAPVSITDSVGIPTQDVEALAFAWLTWAYLNKIAGNLPEVTGASGPKILGAFWPA